MGGGTVAGLLAVTGGGGGTVTVALLLEPTGGGGGIALLELPLIGSAVVELLNKSTSTSISAKH